MAGKQPTGQPYGVGGMGGPGKMPYGMGGAGKMPFGKGGMTKPPYGKGTTGKMPTGKMPGTMGGLGKMPFGKGGKGGKGGMPMGGGFSKQYPPGMSGIPYGKYPGVGPVQ